MMRIISICLAGLFLVVELVTVARPGETKQPFQDAQKHNLKNFIGIARGDLGGKKLKDIVTEETTIRVIVLANRTSAPNSVHLAHVARLIESNPTIESLWTKNKTSGLRKRDSSYANLITFFAVLLEGKNGRFTGLLFYPTDKDDKERIVKVASEAGEGIVRRPINQNRIPRKIPAKVDHRFRPEPGIG